MKLDYSQFHPLDHRIGSRYCREVTNFPDAPKGWHNVILHVRHNLEYRYNHLRPTFLIKKLTLCTLLHRHDVQGGDEIVLFWPSRVTRCCVRCHWQPPGEEEAATAYRAIPKYCMCGHEMNVAHREYIRGNIERWRQRRDEHFKCLVLDCPCEGWKYDKTRTS